MPFIRMNGILIISCNARAFKAVHRFAASPNATRLVRGVPARGALKQNAGLYEQVFEKVKL